MKSRTGAGWKKSVEIRKNRLKRRSNKIFREAAVVFLLWAVVLVMGVLLIFSYNLVLTSPWFRLEKTVVKGCANTTEQDLLLVSGVKPATNILALNVDGIARKIKMNPWVEEVSVVRELPNRLIIEIQERKPIALVKREDSLYFMDGQGVIFKKFEGEEANLPVLTGCGEGGKEDPVLIGKSIELINLLSASNSFPQIKNVSEIHGEEVLGFSIFLDSGLCLRVGFGDYEGKLKRLKSVLADLARRNVNPGFLTIDLNDPGKVTVQKHDLTGGSRGKEVRT
ncbi:MAG TPA: FtsQ-type POTRA domain-containing protein [Syntrophales bacterium]|nr:FtsQ-type POTRA domain-containing protein [Syntrophales bacterium]HRT27198.1 FtsQ-type POTRA domain-containing protein [Syntrophales bacterium]HRT70843.1 FtsQ-type POTRA domain-containing protein [Syntrophales bacterium]